MHTRVIEMGKRCDKIGQCQCGIFLSVSNIFIRLFNALVDSSTSTVIEYRPVHIVVRMNFFSFNTLTLILFFPLSATGRLEDRSHQYGSYLLRSLDLAIPWCTGT